MTTWRLKYWQLRLSIVRDKLLDRYYGLKAAFYGWRADRAEARLERHLRG